MPPQLLDTAWGRPAHLSLLQQPAQSALAHDVAPAHEEADAQGQQQRQQQAAHDARGDGRDLGPGTRRTHTGAGLSRWHSLYSPCVWMPWHRVELSQCNSAQLVEEKERQSNIPRAGFQLPSVQ